MEHETDVAVATRVRISRAYDDLPFIGADQLAAARETERRVCGALRAEDAGFVLLTLRDLEPLGAEELMENGLVSRGWLKRKKTAALLLAGDDMPWIVLNEDDPVRIRASSHGLSVQATYAQANALERQLARRTPFARSDAFGYLTARPEDAGTGLRAAVILHLPAAAWESALEDMAREARRRGLSLQPMSDEEGQPLCDLYTLATPSAFDRTAEQALVGLDEAARALIAWERMLRDKAASRDPDAFADRVSRSVGLLRYALRMDAREFGTHWSHLRLGMTRGLCEGSLPAWDAALPRL